MSNARLKQLMGDNNIKPLKLPPPPESLILSGTEDPRLPKQIVNELKETTLSKVSFSRTRLATGKSNGVTLKPCDYLNNCIFYV